MNTKNKTKSLIIVLSVLIVISSAFLLFIIHDNKETEMNDLEANKDKTVEETVDENSTAVDVIQPDHSYELPEIDMMEFLVEEDDFQSGDKSEETGENQENVIQPEPDPNGFVGSEPGELPAIDLDIDD